jgi:hypothetical protein
LTTLANATVGAQPPDDGMRFGVVATINPLTVDITGGLIPAGIQGGYVPAVGDNVSLIRQDGTWLITGLVGGSSMAFPTRAAIVSDFFSQLGVTSATFVDMGGTNGQMSKASDASGVRLDLFMSCYGTVAETEPSVQVLFTPASGAGAGTAFFASLFRMSTSTFNGHMPLGCHKVFYGLPAGDYNVIFQWRISNQPGGGTINRNSVDVFSAILQED